MPAVICPDRGSDFMSVSMEQAVVQNLRVELTPLPPYCPDGKAIVERFIREVKRRMSASKLKGTYADRPMDPVTKKAARRAQDAAVHSLADAYRSLIEIINDHNNRPHSALGKRGLLAQAGVEPTPKAAYLWGLENITGLRKAPFTDDDYKRMLLATDKASVAGGVLRYRKRPYLPTNEIAAEMAAKSPTRARQVDVRVDKTDPSEIFVVNTQGQWAAFGVTRGGSSEIAGLTLDEEELLSPQTSILWARSENESRIHRVQTISTKGKPKSTATNLVARAGKNEQSAMRASETNALKTALAGNITRSGELPSAGSAKLDEWSRYEEEERLRTLEMIRKQRGKR